MGGALGALREQWRLKHGRAFHAYGTDQPVPRPGDRPGGSRVVVQWEVSLGGHERLQQPRSSDQIRVTSIVPAGIKTKSKRL